MYTISHLFALLLVLGFSRAAERVLPPAGSVLMKSIVVDNSNLPPPKPAATAPTNGPLDWSQIHLDTKICRKNTAGSVVAADNSFLTVIFDDVKTDIGGGDFKVASTGSICSAALQLESPGGYKLKIDSADYRGYYNLNKGVTGMIRTLYEFKGEGRQVRFVIDLYYLMLTSKVSLEQNYSGPRHDRLPLPPARRIDSQGCCPVWENKYYNDHYHRG